MNTVRTVSDTKRAFYTTHTRPINSIYRRVVEELMVEMHLLSVNADFKYDAIYALGLVTAFDRFMMGYRPDTDKVSIFNALCSSIGADANGYRRDAEQLKADASSSTVDDLVAQLKSGSAGEGKLIQSSLQAIAQSSSFKYSRLFAIGLYSFLELINPELVKNDDIRNAALSSLCEVLKLSLDKVQKDLELYRSNLDKITQAQIVLEDILKADRKKREDREKAKQAIATPPESTPEAS
ncbi:MAG TPA: photosystem II biogenesis protein Psp29 [Chroococcidiopsis sp.]